MACLTPAQICNLFADPDCCPTPSESEFRTWQLQLLCSLNVAAGGAGVDSEVVLLCDPVTGQRVVVIYRYDETTGALVSVSATNPDGTAYAGALNSLVACEDAETYVLQHTICDNGVQKLVRVCFNNCVPGVVTYLNPDLTPAAAPLDFDLVSVGECPTLSELKTICLCDDVNADGSVIVNYVDVYKVDVLGTNLTSTFIGSYTDDTFLVPYVPVNPTECDLLGTPLRGQNARRIVLENANTFSPPSALIGTLSIIVISVGNALTPPTFTDSLGNTSTMVEGESFSYSISEDYSFFCNMPIITTNAGDRVHVTWMEAC